MNAPENFSDLITRPSPWLSGEGPHADMVLSTRIRLARNLRSVPFTHRARDEQLQGVLLSVSSAAQRSKSFERGLLLRMNEISPVERQILVERHLLFTGSARARALLADWDGALARFVKITPKDYRRALLELQAERLAAKAAAE